MVIKDAEAKPAGPSHRSASTAAKTATSASAAPRAAASPSRLRPAGTTKPAAQATKPGTSTATAKPAVGSAGSKAPASGPSSAVKVAAAPTATKTAGSAKPAPTKTAAKAGAAAASGPAKASAATGKAGTGKAGAGKTGAGKSGIAKAAAGSAAAAAVSGPPAQAAGAEPGPDPAEEAARRAELEAKAAAEMEALRRAAWQAQVEYERKQEAKRRQEREEEARRKKEEANLRKALLEAAYDDDVAALRSGLDRARQAGLLKPEPVETADGHGNTLLSEAAAGGALEALQMLLQLGAHPNSRGEFLRTPLWRAAFLGKEEVVRPLLEAGADPRIGNEGGELPEHVATAPIKELLAGWDIGRTEQLLVQLEARQQERAAAAAAERAQAVRGAEQSLTEAEEAASRAQQALKHTRMELEKRIHEYDTCVEEKKPEGLTQVALDQVHLAEKAVEDARRKAAEAAEALDSARLRLRREQLQQAEESGAEQEGLPGVPVAVRALNDVLIRDVGGVIAASGKWPLVIDTSGQASVFLRYQDTNYVNALNSRHLEPTLLRRSLLGALRYGKAMVLDLQDCDLWPEMTRVFDQVQPGLLGSLLDKSLLQGERYVSLIRAEDGEEYDRNKFQEARLRCFGFIVLTAARQPNPLLVQQLYALRVMVTE